VLFVLAMLVGGCAQPSSSSAPTAASTAAAKTVVTAAAPASTSIAQSTSTALKPTATLTTVAAATNGTTTVKDMAGRSVTFPAQVNNLVTLYGPGYEKLVMLGAEDRIVAAADFNKTHAAWAHVIYKKLDSLPSIVNPSAPNVEDLIKYKPGVVFWFSNDKNVQAMENAGLPVICSVGNDPTLESLKSLLGIYAQVLGPDAMKKSQEYNAYFDQKAKAITAVTSTIAENKKPRVYVTSGIPLRTRGGKSVMQDTVEKAGGIYVAKDAAQGTANINYEQIMQWNPDIIIIDHAPDLPDPSASATSNTPSTSAVYDQIMQDPQLQAINAVKNKKVYVSPMGAFFWDAGQQGILQLEWMAKLFNPDSFKNIDMQTELKEFYAKFFAYNLTDEQAKMILDHKLPPDAAKWGYK
jgi:iron complex transport system substrate-binding protein